MTVNGTNGLVERVVVPSGVEVEFDSGVFKVTGAKGRVERRFPMTGVGVRKEEGIVVLSSSSKKKRGKRVLFTTAAHVRNMIRGVTEGYMYRLKVCSGHFPMTVKTDKGEVVIGNFLGEKIPRRAQILEGVKVTVGGESVIVESADLERAGQTAANIEVATRIRNRDRRVFQDGIYIVKKPRGEEQR